MFDVNISELIPQFNIADYIQIAILFALIWYSIETRLLRIWQKKQLQAFLFAMELERRRENNRSHGLRAPNINEFPIILRKIYETGKFDLKELYSPAHHKPLLLRHKIWKWIKNKLRRQ